MAGVFKPPLLVSLKDTVAQELDDQHLADAFRQIEIWAANLLPPRPTSTFHGWNVVSGIAATPVTVSSFTVPPTPYARYVQISAIGAIGQTVATDTFQVALTTSGSNISVIAVATNSSNTLNGSGVLPANTADNVLVQASRRAGTGTGSTSSDARFFNIQYTAWPVS